MRDKESINLPALIATVIVAIFVAVVLLTCLSGCAVNKPRDEIFMCNYDNGAYTQIVKYKCPR